MMATVGIQNATHLVKMANAAEYANYYAAASGTPLMNTSTSTDWYSEILRTGMQQSLIFLYRVAVMTLLICSVLVITMMVAS